MAVSDMQILQKAESASRNWDVTAADAAAAVTTCNSWKNQIIQSIAHAGLKSGAWVVQSHTCKNFKDRDTLVRAIAYINDAKHRPDNLEVLARVISKSGLALKLHIKLR